MATNSFLQNYTNQTAAPVKPAAAKPAPNYLGMAGGLLGSLIKPAATAPTVKAQANANPNTQNSFLNNYGTGNNFLASMGQPAKAPEQNIKPVATALPSGQAKTTVTQPTGGTSQAPTTQPTPAQPAAAQFNPNYNLQVGQNNASAPQGTPTPAAPQTPGTPSPYTVNSGLYGQLITGLANRSQQPSQPFTQAMGNAQGYNQALQQSLSNEGNAIATNRLNPIPIGDQTGREAVIRNQYLAQQGALGAGFQGASTLLGATNTQQGLLQQALQQAAAGAAPQSLSPGQYQMSPLSGGAANSAAGQQQGITSATNWGIAQQNITQGQQYQAQAQSISNALQTLHPISQSILPFMSANKLNSQGVPYYNQQINKINSQADPDAFASLQAGVGEAKAMGEQLIVSGGNGSITPTDAGQIVDSWAGQMGNMTPVQLGNFLHNLEVLGQYRLSQAQSASGAGYSANQTVGTPAQGMDADTSQQLLNGASNALNNLPDWAKAGLGALTGVAGAAGTALTNTGGSAVAGGIGGAAGGLAEKVLGI